MAQERVGNSAEDILNLRYDRFLEWNIELEYQAKKAKEEASKRRPKNGYL